VAAKAAAAAAVALNRTKMAPEFDMARFTCNNKTKKKWAICNVREIPSL
jgi:hypothetical protein